MQLVAYLQQKVKGHFNANTLFYNIRCPFHNDHNPSFGIDLTSGSGKCFSCGARPTLANLVERLERGGDTPLNRNQAVRFARTLVLEVRDNPLKRVKKQWATLFDEGVGIDYLLYRGLTLPSIAQFQFESGMNIDWADRERPCILLPVFDPRGKKQGEIIRYIDPGVAKEDRYRESPGFDKFKNLWGIHLAAQPIDCIYVTEGVIDAAVMRQEGFEAVSRMGASLTRYHIKMMEYLTNQIVLVVDNDEAGFKAADACAQKYKVSIGLVDCDCCKDVAEQYQTHGKIEIVRVKARQWLKEKRQDDATVG